jgi:hypothetical protein
LWNILLLRSKVLWFSWCFTLIPLFQDMILNGLHWQQSFGATWFYRSKLILLLFC